MAMEKTTMAKIQAMGIVDDPELEDETAGITGVGIVCFAELVVSRGVRVVVADRTREEREAESDEKDEMLGGRDEIVEAEETELVNDCEERDSDCVDRGRNSVSLDELEKVG